MIEPFEHGSGFQFRIGVNVEVGQKDGDIYEGHATEPELAPGFGDAFDGGEEGGGEGELGGGGEGGRERGDCGGGSSGGGSGGEGAGPCAGQVVVVMVMG